MSRPRPRCPACGTTIVAWSRKGRPRVYCGDQCRWRAGHAAARQRERDARREQLAQWAAMTPAEQLDQLVAAMPRWNADELRAPDRAATGEWAAIGAPRD
jgi:hypothetical protein